MESSRTSIAQAEKTFTGISQIGTLSPFPTEIILLILTGLTYKDLLNCTKVCKFLHDIVNRSLQLRYAAELYAEGFEDVAGMHSDLSVRDRLNLLTRRARAWRTLSWQKRATITLPSSDSLQIANGVLLCKTVEFVPPGPQRRLSLHQLSLVTMSDQLFKDDLEEELVGVYQSFDVSQDLLVLGNVYHRWDDADDDDDVDLIVSRHRLRLSTLSSNGSSPHPDASHEALLLSFDAPSLETEFSVRIAGPLLGAVLEHAARGPCIVIWNWKTGVMLLNMDSILNSTPLYDFCFLSHHRIVLICCALSDLFLEVWSLDPDLSSLNHSRSLLRLSLPDLGSDTYTSFSMSHGPFQPDATQDIPFVKCSDGRVYTIVAQRSDEWSAPALCIVVHHDAISSLLQSTDSTGFNTTMIPWDEWGPRNTRIFLRDMPPRGNTTNGWVCNERLVGTFSAPSGVGGEDYFSMHSQILDFNVRPYLRRSATTSGTASVHGRGQLIMEPTTIALSVDYGSRIVEVTTSLPYYSIPIKIQDIEQNVGFLMDEQHLLGLKAGRGESRRPRGFDVLTFE